MRMSVEDVRGVIEFEDVSFHYIKEGKGLLKDIRRFGLLQDTQIGIRPVTTSTSTRNGKTIKMMKRLLQLKPVKKYWTIFLSAPNRVNW